MSSRDEPITPASASALAGQVTELADQIVTSGRAEQIPEEVVRRLLSDAVRLYAAKAEYGSRFSPLDQEVTATEVAVTSSAMLKAVEMEVFELGMWQVWGRT